MPEGDTIFRTAAALRTAIGGAVMESFEAPRLTGPKPASGSVVESVDSIGKHLEITWSDGVSLRTHMRMTGSWHVYRRGERWRAPRHLMRVVIRTAEWEAVCFNAPDVESYRTRAGVVPAALARLGPDLMDDDADIDACVGRLTSLSAPDDTIADLLLDQRVACGVGNVFKSEALFACRIDPFMPARLIDEPVAHRLLTTASEMLRANRQSAGRTTTGGTQPGTPPLAVYDRVGRPCLVCATPIRTARHGRDHRSTFWCPTCQSPLSGQAGDDDR